MLKLRTCIFISFVVLFCRPARPAKDGAHTLDVDLLSDGFFGLRDYEVFDVIEEGQEDVVYLRKRTDDDCDDTDCLAYSAWTKDSVMECSDDEDSGNDENDGDQGQNILGKRNGKSSDFCKGVDIETPGYDPKVKTRTGFTLESRNVLTPAKVEEKYKRVYDIGDPTKPYDAAWYKVARRSKRWTANSPGVSKERCYNVEHVLEWQMMKHFIESDMKRPDDKMSRCQFIMRYFLKANGMDKKNLQVTKAKNPEKDLRDGERWQEISATFELEKFPGDLKSLDWIGLQWPGKAGAQATPPSPWEYEFVPLNDDMNNKKADVWRGSHLFPEPVLEKDSDTMSQVNQKNSETQEWLYLDKYYDGKQIRKWPDRKGQCKAVARFNDLMGLVYYHNDPIIREIMRAQVKRVGEAWDHLETNVVAGTSWTDSTGAKHDFQKQDLKQEWFTFMKNAHEVELERITKELDAKRLIFENKSPYVAKIKRWDFGGLFSKRAVRAPKCGVEKDAAKMSDRVKLLLKAHDDLPAIKTDLDLT